MAKGIHLSEKGGWDPGWDGDGGGSIIFRGLIHGNDASHNSMSFRSRPKLF